MKEMRFLLIDANSILNRAFYGIRLLTTKDGTPTNGIYGFLNILFKYIEELSPTHIAAAFDLKAPTFRHKMYDGYKANRKPMPEELRPQFPILKEILSATVSRYQITSKNLQRFVECLPNLTAHFLKIRAFISHFLPHILTFA